MFETVRFIYSLLERQILLRNLLINGCSLTVNDKSFYVLGTKFFRTRYVAKGGAEVRKFSGQYIIALRMSVNLSPKEQGILRGCNPLI